ncbi:hypothetical protein [Flavobacterium sp.]|uniref:hypothetical protein n=1 Tax=Flavobacterium sp. TaxID=239 RepID=UPI0040476948
MKQFILFSLFILFLLLGISYSFLNSLGLFDKEYSTNEILKEFNDKKDEIYEVKKYFEKIKPIDSKIDLEIGENNTLFYFNIWKKEELHNFSNVEINSKEYDSLLKIVKWNDKNINELKNLLKNANCISIDQFNKEDCLNIGFKRSGLSKYYFRLFNKPLNDSLKSNLNSERSYLINDSVVLYLNGGAIDSEYLPIEK